MVRRSLFNPGRLGFRNPVIGFYEGGHLSAKFEYVNLFFTYAVYDGNPSGIPSCLCD